MKNTVWLHLLRKKGSRRGSTALIVLPGLVPNSILFKGTVIRLVKFGDLWELSYPAKYIETDDLLRGVTAELKYLHYAKVVLIGVSFGGMLAYRLLRYWRHHRVSVSVLGLVAVSSPFAPSDVSWRARTELQFGYGLDKHRRSLFKAILKLIRWLWWYDLRIEKRMYARENSLQQIANGLRIGYVLRQERVVNTEFNKLSALLLNTSAKVRDELVTRRNEISFKKLFPAGEIVHGLARHADLDKPDRLSRLALNRFLSKVVK